MKTKDKYYNSCIHFLVKRVKKSYCFFCDESPAPCYADSRARCKNYIYYKTGVRNEN